MDLKYMLVHVYLDCRLLSAMLGLGASFLTYSAFQLEVVSECGARNILQAWTDHHLRQSHHSAERTVPSQQAYDNMPCFKHWTPKPGISLTDKSESSIARTFLSLLAMHRAPILKAFLSQNACRARGAPEGLTGGRVR